MGGIVIFSARWKKGLTAANTTASASTQSLQSISSKSLPHSIDLRDNPAKNVRLSQPSAKPN